MISKLLKNKIVKNASWLIFGRVAQMLINLLVTMLTARYLGPSNYGLIGYAGAYTAFFMSFCTLGINSILVKEFISEPEKEGEIIGTTLVLRVISSIFSSLTILCIVFFVDAGEPITITVVALCSIGVIFNIFEVFNYWFQAHLQSKITALVSLVAYFITALYKIVLLLLGKSVVWFAFATSIDYICIGIMLFFMYYIKKGKLLKFSFDCAKNLLNQSHHFIISGLMVSIYGQTDKLMLKQIIDQSEVAFYSAAVSICNVWCFVLSAIIDSMYPSIMEANKTDEHIFIKRNKQLYAIIFYVSFFVSVLFIIFSPLTIKILYGDAYMPAINPLRIITWYTAFSYLGVARNAWVVCKGCQDKLKYIYIFSAIINVILNILLIPFLGATGAAVASLIAQISTSLIFPLFIKDLRENSIMMLEAIIFKGLK